jgi:GntP family gluconate:H+ symporter
MLELILIISVAFLWIVLSTAKWHWHPFLSILVAALGTGIALRLPLSEVVATASSGFGSILASIGIVIVLGSILGNMMEATNAATTIANALMRGMGRKYPMLALASIGALVGIPVFCDAGFIILSKLTDTIAKSSKASPVGLSVSLAAGLYSTHTLVPPTPGPIAAAGTLGASSYLGLVILIGIVLVVVSLPVMVTVIRFLTKNTMQKPNLDLAEIHVEHAELPTISSAILPLAIPIGLISIGTISSMAGNTIGWVSFIGHPIVALLITLFISYFLLKMKNMQQFGELATKGLVQSGPILIITGAGGAFGAILKSSSLSSIFQVWLADLGGSGWILLALAFVVAAFLKTAQGSSTAAIVITAALIAPFLPEALAQSPVYVTLVIMSIGAGAMTLSHTNDSFFWVVSQITRLEVKDAYRTYSIMTAIQGAVIFILISGIYSIYTMW